ncbi:MAG TPA: citramalate synthase [Nitrospiria bacterium]|nr:citramalate synthase [Nitrospiria bacterium]
MKKKNEPTIELYDTTLRDGAQAEDIAFSVEDKLLIVQRLDELGVPYIEGGWPGANPKDVEFFKEVRRLTLKQAQIAAFGATRRAKYRVQDDPSLKALLDAQTPIITIFGKSWDLHVTEALGVSLKKNLELIGDSVGYLKSKRKMVVYDAEHFFDGYKANPEYALATLARAQAAGSDRIALCDTNGGNMPWEVRDIVAAVAARVTVPLGIHAHNDAEVAVANSLVAVEQGVVQVQGTINGFGERCGNANLCSLIPNLQLKLQRPVISTAQLAHLTDASRYVFEIANLPAHKRQPYVGESAFAHKGGVHVHAVRKKAETYEHVRPEVVGNRRRILVSDAAGRGSLLEKAAEYGIDLDAGDPRLHDLLNTLKELERQGYQFEGADASFELLMRKALGTHRRFFDLIGFRVTVDKRREGEDPLCEATIMLRVGEDIEHTAAVGAGPVNALDHALRKALEGFYPQLRRVRLLDYKVRVLAAQGGTASRVRVLIESGDQERKWGTVGVSSNIIEASWQALVDGIEYRLLRGGSSRP